MYELYLSPRPGCNVAFFLSSSKTSDLLVPGSDECNDLLRFVRIHLAAGSRMTDRGLVARTVAPHEVARMGIAWRGFRIVDQDGIGAAFLV